jgi:hypothetical protein
LPCVPPDPKSPASPPPDELPPPTPPPQHPPPPPPPPAPTCHRRIEGAVERASQTAWPDRDASHSRARSRRRGSSLRALV